MSFFAHNTLKKFFLSHVNYVQLKKACQLTPFEQLNILLSLRLLLAFFEMLQQAAGAKLDIPVVERVKIKEISRIFFIINKRLCIVCAFKQTENMKRILRLITRQKCAFEIKILSEIWCRILKLYFSDQTNHHNTWFLSYFKDFFFPSSLSHSLNRSLFLIPPRKKNEKFVCVALKFLHTHVRECHMKRGFKFQSAVNLARSGREKMSSQKSEFLKERNTPRYNRA